MNDTYSILLVDDEKDITDLIQDILHEKNSNYHITIANSFKDAEILINKFFFDTILLDIWLHNQNDGVELLKAIRERNKNTQVIMISGHGNIKIALQCIRIGAYDYLEKPFKSDKLRIVVKNALEVAQMKKTLSAQELLNDKFTKIVGKSKAISHIRILADEASSNNSRVFINGGGGLGKKLIGRYIHKKSHYKNDQFIVINSSNSIVNGNFRMLYHEFKGTVFLEEITNFPLHFQKSLLDFINSSQFHNSGKQEFRIITSNSRNIQETIKAGFFNQDLFNRLNAVTINVPALCNRIEDIPELCKFFINYFVELNHLSFKEFTEDAIYKLQQYDWPGNVTQLKSIIEWILMNNNHLKAQNIDSSRIAMNIFDNNVNNFDTQKILQLQLKDARDEFEKYYLLFHLKRYSLSITKTADYIKMDRSALHRKLKSLRVDCEDL
jgi:two-component system nitrogen regulation response regulator NtrX